ncbi:hypothetical protein P3342_000443 [Pyrenophora teres f. teres]|nr:hypothetical protein HRS9139_04474 [Pyrenophora teres f. teres]KAE8837653.1 hypothetical protein PTNB85_04988 [Pyrenophora teres f. teres]KAE8839927.1 hypothetical protein HRS9122_06532 [Pyrenophora teres f. teres]KAE8862476.1 hypothetical protein PTNB29_05038 [Pyrenophora teres f. teres]KAE8869285.1 hypothetical protein PTNB73_04338 [Pyrenophora teres f. teres]
MSNTSSPWIWSDDYQDHYYVTSDQYGRPVYNWYKSLSRNDLATVQENAILEDVPPEIRANPRFIPGTPQTGWYDLLDPSYQMRSGSDARRFFVEGRVFAMLYSQAASQTARPDPGDGAFTVVRFGESVHTNIRRFVVVEVKRGFVYACGIATYSHRGTLKPGCNPVEHAIVYFRGTDPRCCYLPGEVEGGMTKDPIEVEPADPAMVLKPDSRIRFGKIYPIEMNVKVKDIGRVSSSHLSLLRQYREDER